MAGWKLARPTQRFVDAPTWSGSNTVRTAVVASATPHSKGAWVELVATTTAEWAGFELIAGSSSTAATDTSTLLDIGVGAAGSEVVVLADLPVGYSAGGNMTIPLRIHEGVRVSARTQSAVASKSISFALFPWAGGSGFESFTGATTYGATAASSQGTSVSWGGSTNTLGSWTDIAATTTAPARALLIGVQGAGDTDLAGIFRLEIAVGAAGAEQVIGVMGNSVASAEAMNGAYLGNFSTVPLEMVPIAVNVPEGARLSARMSSSNASLPALDVVLIGLR